MADEEADTNESIEPEQKYFYGFALYMYDARRYNLLNVTIFIIQSQIGVIPVFSR